MQKKALIHNPYWDTLGGGERYVASVVKFLLTHGWQVDIVWPKNISPTIHSRFGIDISKARYVSHEVFTAHYKLAFYVSDGSLPLSFARKTLVHFQFPFTAINGSTFPNQLKSKFYTFICNSQFTKSFIDQEFSVQSDVLYPPVDTAKFKSGKKTKTIVYVGRFSQLTQLKNQDQLIKAFTAIHKKLPGWKLILAGGVGIGADSSYLASLYQSVKKLPIHIIENPTFVELQKVYAEATLFWSASGFGANEAVSPTQVEHFGITLVEAMAAGCIPIVSNLGGHKEIVEDTTSGFLVTSLAELETKTLELLTDKTNLSKLSQNSIIRSRQFDVSTFNLCLQKYLSS